MSTDTLDQTASTETESKPVAAPRAPIVTLWLPREKSSRAVFVRGFSGKKYTFQRVAGLNRPARQYFDLATFEAEERDIRENTRSLYAVCTLLGSADSLATQAPVPATPVATPVAPAPQAPDPAPVAASAPVVEAESTPVKTWQPKETYTEAQLNEMPLDDLRALAAHYSVPGDFRRNIIRQWFKPA